jgi:hypothetical protein
LVAFFEELIRNTAELRSGSQQPAGSGSSYHIFIKNGEKSPGCKEGSQDKATAFQQAKAVPFKAENGDKPSEHTLCCLRMNTYFASPERTDKKTLAAKINFVDKNPVISALLSSVGGLIEPCCLER